MTTGDVAKPAFYVATNIGIIDSKADINDPEIKN